MAAAGVVLRVPLGVHGVRRGGDGDVGSQREPARQLHRAPPAPQLIAGDGCLLERLRAAEERKPQGGRPRAQPTRSSSSSHLSPRWRVGERRRLGGGADDGTRSGGDLLVGVE